MFPGSKEKAQLQPANRLPPWLRRSLAPGREAESTQALLEDLGLNTICESGRCPNRNECWSLKTATFMAMGNRCTRTCRYCSVPAGKPEPLDSQEPAKIAQAAQRLDLRHIVVTSVTRDDLPEGGARHFAAIVAELRRRNPKLVIELLVPDFRNAQSPAVSILKELDFDIFNHNIETVRRIHPSARPQGGYELSLNLISKMRDANPRLILKSGAMLGLGETPEEISEMMDDLLARGCHMLTMGQYLESFHGSMPVSRFLPPEEFEAFRQMGYNKGFSLVESGPWVRSSYHAKSSFDRLKKMLKEIRQS